MNSSNSPASPPGSIGDGWPRAKSPNGSSSVNWPPGTPAPGLRCAPFPLFVGFLLGSVLGTWGGAGKPPAEEHEGGGCSSRNGER